MLNGLYETFSTRSWLPNEAWNFTPAASSGAYGCSNFLTKSAGRWPPYMLSPSMMTRSNAKVARALAICCPTSYCGRSPVPLSPMTANFNEPGRLGSETAGCASTAAETRAATMAANGGAALQQSKRHPCPP